MGKATELMRELSYHGVTHFVVTDGLHEQIRQEANERAFNFGFDRYSDRDAPLFFRQRRILRQVDLDHLPFNPSPADPPDYYVLARDESHFRRWVIERDVPRHRCHFIAGIDSIRGVRLGANLVKVPLWNENPSYGDAGFRSALLHCVDPAYLSGEEFTRINN